MSRIRSGEDGGTPLSLGDTLKINTGLADDHRGEALHAFVVLKPGANATEDELRRFARDCMAHFKVPKHFNFVTDLPKTATDKIQKCTCCAEVVPLSPSSSGPPQPVPLWGTQPLSG